MRRKISVSPQTIARLLKQRLHFSLKTNRKAIAETQHPDRNRQFQYIAHMAQRFAARGEPAISVDSKKKELIGNFYNHGQAWCRQAQVEARHSSAFV